MELSESVLLGVITVLALNQAAVRLPAVYERPWAFWLVNLIDLVAGLGILIFGLPGFDHAPPVRFVVGLLFLMHIGQNLKLQSDRDADARDRRREEILEERRRLKESAPEE